MTYLEQGFGYTHSGAGEEPIVGIVNADPETATDFACNSMCPHCTILSYCPMEANHYGAHRCTQGHSF